MRARTRKAIVLDTPGNAVIMEVPVPPVRPVYALVKTTAVALNAVDSYSIDYYGSNGTISGCDFAGEVVEVGSQVEQDLKPGDRVAGFVHGNKTDSMDVVTELFQEAVSGKRSGAHRPASPRPTSTVADVPNSQRAEPGDRSFRRRDVGAWRHHDEDPGPDV